MVSCLNRTQTSAISGLFGICRATHASDQRRTPKSHISKSFIPDLRADVEWKVVPTDGQ